MKDWEPHDPQAERRLRIEAWFIGALMLIALVSWLG